MKRYQDEHQRELAMVKAHAEIKDFLEHHASYTELMEYAAKAQAEVFGLLRLIDENESTQISVTGIHEFFYFAIKAFELLEPFTEEKLYV